MNGDYTTGAVMIVMGDEDFDFLARDKTPWEARLDWRQQVRNGRFETRGGAAAPPSMNWKVAYWVGPHYVAVILARAFLAAKGFECEVVFDNAEDGSWVILTDYDHAWGNVRTQQ